MHNYEAAGARMTLLAAIKRKRERSRYCQLVARIVVIALDRGGKEPGYTRRIYARGILSALPHHDCVNNLTRTRIVAAM